MDLRNFGINWQKSVEHSVWWLEMQTCPPAIILFNQALCTLVEMNDKNAFRVLVALASVILVSMIALTVLARMDLIHGLGIQHANQTATASADQFKDLQRQFSNFTSTFFH